MKLDRTKTREHIINVVGKLPKPICGCLAYDDPTTLNLRQNCINMFDEIFATRPINNILEIGTHIGSSAAIMLSRSNAKVLSVDCGDNYLSRQSLNETESILINEFPGRFKGIIDSSHSESFYELIKDELFDFAFVDGDHSYEGCLADLQLCAKLNIPFILVDDYTSSLDVYNAVKQFVNIPRKDNFYNKYQEDKLYEQIHNNANIGLVLLKKQNINEY